MDFNLSAPQSELLHQAQLAGTKGLLKSTSYGPAIILVNVGYLKWSRKLDNGRMGMLEVTAKGRNKIGTLR